MGWINKYIFLIIFLILITSLFSGCASLNSKKFLERETFRKEEKTGAKGWWYAKFRMDWPKDAEPLWHMDPLLAHRVIAPVLSRYSEEISLWRFHRRAAPDASGHQFSFIFYADPQVADRVFASIRSNRILKDMKSAGIILEDVYDDTGRISKPNVEDTSDRNWSLPIQKSWPYFIMGVSQAWLDLIEQGVVQRGKIDRSASCRDILAFYKGVNEDIGATWQKEGQHAFLHHLNALFGYEPLVIYEKRLTTF